MIINRIAHTYHNRTQTIKEHLLNTAKISSNVANKIGLLHCGELIGLLHDIGKYSDSFQKKLAVQSDEKIDHATAGAQYFLSKQIKENYYNQLLTIPILSHHNGGPINVFTHSLTETKETYNDRLQKEIDISYKNNIDSDISMLLDSIINSPLIYSELNSKYLHILKRYNNDTNSKPANIELGLLCRYLLSCLDDPDNRPLLPG